MTEQFSPSSLLIDCSRVAMIAASDRDDACLPVRAVKPRDDDEIGHEFGSFPVSPTSSTTEEYFGSLGPMSREQGWCVFPQERVGKRMPGKVDGEVLKPSKYHEIPPTQQEVEYWAEQHFSTNVAVILGPASGGVWALDIDVMDLDLALRIKLLAFRVLGRTEFRRVGNNPKQAMFYRAATPADMPRSRSFTFTEEDSTDASKHMIEFLGARKVVTLYGRHHQTLRDFKWLGYGQPALSHTSEVPAVTPEQIDEFLRQLQELRAFTKPVTTVARSATIPGEQVTLVPTDIVSPLRMRRLDGDWTRDEAGLVVDGRERFAFAVAMQVCRQNPGACLTDDGRRNLLIEAHKFFCEHASLAGWDYRVEGELTEKIRRISADIVAGRIDVASKQGTRVEKQAEKAVEETAAAAPSWYTTPDDPSRPTAWLDVARFSANAKHQDFTGIGIARKPSATAPDDLRIPQTPEGNQRTVAAEVDRQLDDWLRKALDHAEKADMAAAMGDESAPSSTSPARLIAAGAGGGKTTRCLSKLAERTGEQPLRALFLVDRYELVEQVRADAIKAGFDPEKVMIWVGRGRSAEYDDGCHRPIDIARLQSSGRSGALLCSAKTKAENGDETEVFCPRFRECLYQRNVANVAKMDLVIGVHEYIHVPIPKELKASRIVVVDEKIREKIQREASLSPGLIVSGRDLKFLSKKEKESGLDRETISANRQYAGSIVYDAVLADRDPALEFVGPEHAERRAWLEHAIAICGRKLDADPVTPETDGVTILEIAMRARETQIMQESRFWKLISERVEDLEHDRVHAELAAASNAPYTPRIKQPRDRRIHLYRDADGKPRRLQLSWIGSYNFEQTPMLFLDASADVDLLRTCLGRALEFEPIEAFARVRSVLVNGESFATSSIVRRENDSTKVAFRKARRLLKLRTAVTTICAQHPGGVLVCSTVALEELLTDDGWMPPPNATVVHYGNTRGLNFASGYDAAILVGNLNPSGEQIDVAAAPYLYNVAGAEPMIDPKGRLASEGGRFEFRDVEIRMRNGAILRMKQRACERTCPIAQKIYEQIRDEEHRQAAARLRFLFRPDVPTLYFMGAFVPPETILDEVVTLDDVVAFGAPYERTRTLNEPIEAFETDVPEFADEARLHRQIATTPALESAHIRVTCRSTGETKFHPRYHLIAAQTAAKAGKVRIDFVPERSPIVRPLGWHWSGQIDGPQQLENETLKWVSGNLDLLLNHTAWRDGERGFFEHPESGGAVHWTELSIFERQKIDGMRERGEGTYGDQ